MVLAMRVRYADADLRVLQLFLNVLLLHALRSTAAGMAAAMIKINSRA